MPRIDGQVTSKAGQTQTGIVSRRTATTGADQQIDLGVDCTNVSLLPETGDLHINWANDAAATTSHAKLPAGQRYTYEGPPLRVFRVISSVAGFVNITAY